MIRKKVYCSLVLVVLVTMPLHVLYANKINYDESQVPQYVLPDPLVMNDGTRVLDKAQWQKKRRNEILDMFKEHVYGAMPPSRDWAHVERYSLVKDALNGKARILQETLFFHKDLTGPKVEVCVFLPIKPADSNGYPAFLALNFFGNHTIHSDPIIRKYEGYTWRTYEAGGRDSFWNVEKIVSRGYALITACYSDFDPDYHHGEARTTFHDGVHPLFPEYQCRPDNWASIGAWAWGMSRLLDYAQTIDEIDACRVAVMGHSRLGKAALWAGATDERFAMVISNNSGCGGAALARRCFGETVAQINDSMPHWFCKKYKQYSHHEDQMPVDQHLLISLMAPRPVYVASAIEDKWCDPRGEFLACVGADSVYKLLGTAGLPSKHWPSENTPMVGRIGYHVRKGGHAVTAYDWEQYLDFADIYLKSKQ